jgi:ABC-type dipeptide/oligopeptide/nickel transport system permease component
VEPDVRRVRVLGDAPPLWTAPDVNTLTGLAVWSAVLVVFLSLLADVATVLLDPRIKARSR